MHVWARRRPAADELVDRLAGALPDAQVAAVATAEEAVREGDIVITATASREAIVDGAWLRPGHHVTAVGADDDTKRELATSCFSRADQIVVDGRAQTCGTAELAQAIAEGVIDAGAVLELGDVLQGRRAGRLSEGEITIAKLSGLGVQDLAAATLALDKAGVVT